MKMYSAFTRTKNAAIHSKDIMSNPRWNKSTLLYKKQAPIYSSRKAHHVFKHILFCPLLSYCISCCHVLCESS